MVPNRILVFIQASALNLVCIVIVLLLADNIFVPPCQYASLLKRLIKSPFFLSLLSKSFVKFTKSISPFTSTSFKTSEMVLTEFSILFGFLPKIEKILAFKISVA